MVKVFEEPVSITDEHIFNTAVFLRFKHGKKVCFSRYDNGEPVAQINFTIHKGKAISGYQATYGSFDIVNPRNELFYHELLEAVEQEFLKIGILEIMIKHWPESYNSYSFKNLFEQQGYSL